MCGQGRLPTMPRNAACTGDHLLFFHTNNPPKTKSGQPPKKKASPGKKNAGRHCQAGSKNKNGGGWGKSTLAPTRIPPPTSVPRPRRPQAPAPIVLHHNCMRMPGRPPVPQGSNQCTSHTTPGTVSLTFHAFSPTPNQPRHATQQASDGPYLPTLRSTCTQLATVSAARGFQVHNPTNSRVP